MKLTLSVMILALVASASAQQAQKKQAQPVKPAATQSKAVQHPVAPKAATTAMKPAAKHSTATKAVAAKPVHKTVMPVHKVIRKKSPVVHEAKTEVPAARKEEVQTAAAPVSQNKRDPFRTIIVDRSGPGACAGGGKQCLVPDEVALRGIVRANGGIIAVVTNKDNRAYFLRENDPVLNGVVTRITDASITFRETVTDMFGKRVTREVVKKINPTTA